MIVFAPSLRNARRSRKIPTVASVVRVIGTVRISEVPQAGPACSAPGSSPSTRGSASQTHGGRRPHGATPWPG